MHLTVGYLATPTGDDGVALAIALARTLDAAVDVVLVVRHELPDGEPGRGQYQEILLERGQDWIRRAVDTFAAAGIRVESTVLLGDSFPEALMHFAEEKNSDLIVVGGARDGLFGGHIIGPVAGALLHSSPIPVALATRGYADDAPDRIDTITAAVPTRPGDDNPLPFALELAGAAGVGLRMLSLVSSEHLAETDDIEELRALQLAAAEANLAVAARELPDAPELDCVVAGGRTLESALKKLTWSDTDVLVIGSSRFAAPKRIFLGSTASRILAGAGAPVIVVPRAE